MQIRIKVLPGDPINQCAKAEADLLQHFILETNALEAAFTGMSWQSQTMTTPNPMDRTYPEQSQPLSKETHCVGGLLTTVYGLNELQADIRNVACLWLLHPRLQTQECMEPIACSTIDQWNLKLRNNKKSNKATGLIAVSFDQRNHGTREVAPMANEAWRTGNEKHAQDMFASYHGTAIDTSHLITYVSSYIFPHSNHSIVNNFVLGVSLGGHAAWHCLMQDPRVTTAIVIIGCPDYIRLMSDVRLVSFTVPLSATFRDFRDTFREDLPLGIILRMYHHS